MNKKVHKRSDWKGKSMSVKHIFKVEAEGDTVYIEAVDKETAKARLTEIMGPIPASMLRWSSVDKLPKGEEFL